MTSTMRFAAVAVLLLGSVVLLAQQATDATAIVYRAPFSVKLQTDNGDYTQKFDKVAYVAENLVNIFAGESFGINLTGTGDEMPQVTYQPDLNKADVTFTFTQENSGNRKTMMLVIKNKLKRRLFLDAEMLVPEKKGTYKTSIIPIEGGLSSFEMWPHPIVQLVLGNFRFSNKPAK